MKHWTTLLLAAFLLNAGVFAKTASACPGCKDSIGGDNGATNGTEGASASLPGGFNSSVYLMLGGLFGTMGLVGWVVVKGARTPSSRSGGFPIEPKSEEDSDEKPEK
jgi:hypothetical protein